MTTGASDNTVGGTTAAARNIISGVNGNGISFIDSTAEGRGNSVALGNYVGTDATGAVALGNAGDGIDDRGCGAMVMGGSGGWPG